MTKILKRIIAFTSLMVLAILMILNGLTLKLNSSKERVYADAPTWNFSDEDVCLGSDEYYLDIAIAENQALKLECDIVDYENFDHSDDTLWLDLNGFNLYFEANVKIKNLYLFNTAINDCELEFWNDAHLEVENLYVVGSNILLQGNDSYIQVHQELNIYNGGKIEGYFDRIVRISDYGNVNIYNGEIINETSSEYALSLGISSNLILGEASVSNLEAGCANVDLTSFTGDSLRLSHDWQTTFTEFASNEDAKTALNKLSFNNQYFGARIDKVNDKLIVPCDLYNISFNTDGGSEIDSIIDYKLPNKLPTPTKDNCIFEGWYTDVYFIEEAIPGSEITESKVLYAKFTYDTSSWPTQVHACDYPENPHYYLTGDTFYVGEELKIVGRLFFKDDVFDFHPGINNYTSINDFSIDDLNEDFSGWYHYDEDTDKYVLCTECTEFHIVYSANGGTGTVPVDSNVYHINDKVTFMDGTNLTKEGYVFIGWNYFDAQYYINRTSFSVTIDQGEKDGNQSTITLYAVWAKIRDVNVDISDLNDVDKTRLVATAYDSSAGYSDVVGYTTTSEGFIITKYLSNGDDVFAYYEEQIGYEATVQALTPICPAEYIDAEHKYMYFEKNTGFIVYVDIDNSQFYVALFNEMFANTTYEVLSLEYPTTLTYDINGGEGTLPTDNKIYYPGDTVNVKDGNGITKEGSEFLGWSLTKNGDVVDSFVMTSEGATLYAKWSSNREEINLILNPQEYLYTENGGNKYVIDSSLEGFVIEYYRENSWDTNAPSFVGKYNIRITRPKDDTHEEYNSGILENYFCIYGEIKYILDKATSGSVPEVEKFYEYYDYEELEPIRFTLVEPTLARTGYVFDGWIVYADYEKRYYQPGDEITLSSENFLIYPDWKIALDTISYAGNNYTVNDITTVEGISDVTYQWGYYNDSKLSNFNPTEDVDTNGYLLEVGTFDSKTNTITLLNNEDGGVEASAFAMYLVGADSDTYLKFKYQGNAVIKILVAYSEDLLEITKNEDGYYYIPSFLVMDKVGYYMGYIFEKDVQVTDVYITNVLTPVEGETERQLQNVTSNGEYVCAVTYKYTVYDTQYTKTTYTNGVTPKTITLKDETSGKTVEIYQLEGRVVTLPSDTFTKKECTIESWNYKNTTTTYAPGSNYTVGTEDTYFLVNWSEPTHNVTPVDGKEATCTAQGNKGYYYCSGCETYYEDEACSIVIGDEDALNTWKTEGNGLVVALGHNLEHHDAKAPGCESIGWDAYDTCSRCEYTTYNELAVLGHKALEAVVENRVEPTCTVDGHYDEVVYCERCNEELSRNNKSIDKLGHNYNAVVTNPTCTEQGYTTHTCSRCNDTYVDTYVTALGHNSVTDNKVDPTCTTTGLTEGSHCSRCNEVLVAQTVVEALGHNLEHHDAKAPGCESIGWDAYDTCSRCEYITYVEKSALGHKALEAVVENRVEPTCTVDGHYDEVVYCERCNEELSRNNKTIDKLGHNYNAVVTNPTCTEQGYTTHTCSRCNDTYVDTYVEALGHNSATDNKVDPTCTTTGLTEGSHCSRCSEVLVAQAVVEALGHNSVTDNKVDPTCTTTGLTEGSHCSRCSEVLVAQTVVEALGHNSVTDNKVDPTCTTTGLTEGSHCSRCSEVLVAQTVVEALGHAYGEYVSNNDATLEHDGTKTRICANDNSHVDTVTDVGTKKVQVINNSTSTEDGQPSVSVTTENGFDPDVKVVVEITIETEVETKINENKLHDYKVDLAKNEVVGVVFDVKLKRTVNGVETEIQPTDLEGVTSIKVLMKLPESMNLSKITRILHVHSDGTIEEYEFDPSKVTSDGYYEISISKLSEFAFIYRADNSSTGLIVGLIILLLILLLLIIYILGYFLLYRKGLLDDHIIRVIYKFLPRGDYNRKDNKEDKKESQEVEA